MSENITNCFVIGFYSLPSPTSQLPSLFLNLSMKAVGSVPSLVSFSPLLLCRRDKKRFSFSLDPFLVPLHLRPQYDVLYLHQLKHKSTLCASSGETMRADKEPILGTNDAHSAHMRTLVRTIIGPLTAFSSQK